MKGIILAGGHGTRLYPATAGVCKQLLPVYDKPMIYHPLSVLMLAGITDILIISTPQDLPRFKCLFKDGSHLGLTLSYLEQARPGGLAEAFLLGEPFIGRHPVCLILGDNIFYGHGLTQKLTHAQQDTLTRPGATLFGYSVQDPTRYGILEFHPDRTIKTITEKPTKPTSHWAVTGLYFYDNSVIEKAKTLTPSARGELEITDINNLYLKEKTLRVELLGRGYAWLDTGTHDSLLEASNFIATLEKRQGQKIACLEEIAYRLHYIDKEQLLKLASLHNNNAYSNYLTALTDAL